MQPLLPDQNDAPQADDAAIRRAFQRSLMVVGMVVILGGAVLFWWAGRNEKSVEKTMALNAPEPSRAAAQPPETKFTDITVDAGIKFNHVNGAAGEKLLPETMGGGVAFFD